MSRSAERLTLPEPAAGLWNRTREAIRDCLAEIGASEYRIGGGTILAARWDGHRRSYDLDLSVGQDVPLFVLRNSRLSKFAERMATTGGTVLPPISPELVRVRFDNEDGSQQAIDIRAHVLQMPGAEGRAEIAGRTETVLSTAQILWGKLARGDKNLPRDVYDVVKAAEKDPTSLEIAVNAHQRQWTEHVALEWYWRGRDIANEAAQANRRYTARRRRAVGGARNPGNQNHQGGVLRNPGNRTPRERAGNTKPDTHRRTPTKNGGRRGGSERSVVAAALTHRPHTDSRVRLAARTRLVAIAACEWRSVHLAVLSVARRS